MAATSVTGRGIGTSVPYSKGPDGGRSAQYLPANGPHIVLTGVCSNIGQPLPYKIRVSFPELPYDPSYYSMFVLQTDPSDGSGEGADITSPHVSMRDANGNFANDGFDSGFAGFVLHTGTSNEASFMWMIVKNGKSAEASL